MTNRIALRTVEEFMQDYVPIYQPLFPLFMGKSQAYPADVGQLTFKRANTVGDIRQKHITPKDTELAQVAVNEGSKIYKKYFLANQYVQSNFQDLLGNEDVIKQVLDEHQRQADELFLLGEGTDASSMLNNGLFWSNDPNYVLNNSATIAWNATNGNLPDFHTQICAQSVIANQIAGRKALIVYGTSAVAILNSLYATSNQAFATPLQQVLGSDYSIVKMPADVTPSGANGFIIANLDQVKTHYTLLPELHAQGVNDEKMYTWHNFAMGSMMVEVLVNKAIIRQPCTFASS